jgi:hypothetical protein
MVVVVARGGPCAAVLCELPLSGLALRRGGL